MNKNPDGSLSLSRSLLIGAAVIQLTAWTAVGIGIGLGAFAWETFAGWMTWGRDFFFVTVIPYATNKLIANRKSPE